MSKRGEVLVAIINNKRDMDIAREQNWYRIPMGTQGKFVLNLSEQVNSKGFQQLNLFQVELK